MVTDLATIGGARVNWGRWIVDCQVCPSGMAVSPGTPGTRCLDCGSLIGPIAWPADPDGVEAILSQRPDPNTRNWEPGETLENLLAENAAHGCLPQEWMALDSRTLLLATADNRVVGGLLHHQLEAAGRREIGA